MKTHLGREQVISIGWLQQGLGCWIAVQGLNGTMHNVECAWLLNGECGVRRERHRPTDLSEEEIGWNVHVGITTAQFEDVRFDPDFVAKWLVSK